jgi:hypothetical protein
MAMEGMMFSSILLLMQPFPSSSRQLDVFWLKPMNTERKIHRGGISFFVRTSFLFRTVR